MSVSVPPDRSCPPEESRLSTGARSSSPPQSGIAVERLADDLLVEILSRVPATSICRFKCVSKGWLSLINHPDHRKKLPQTLAGFFHTRSDTGVLPLDSEVRFASVSGKSCPPIDTSLGFLPVHHRGVNVVDCCNGLLLCRCLSYISAPGDELCYIVCNPATEEWFQLPDRSHGDVSKVSAVRLGFDPAMSSHFYVFVMLRIDFNSHVSGVDVYSSETGRWNYKEERWDELMWPLARSAHVFLDGCLYFQAYGRKLTSRCLGVVDTKGETWAYLGIPSYLYDGFVQQSQGRPHYAYFVKDRLGDVVGLVVYVLEDYDSKEWILKHNAETSNLFGGTNVPESDRLAVQKVDSRWIAIHPGCNLIFFTVGCASKLMCYDMDRRQAKVICNLDGYQPRLPYVPLYAELQPLRMASR